MPGQLLTADFLREGIRRTTAYRGLDPDERNARVARIRDALEKILEHSGPNEAVTEADLIYPVLEILGWRPPLVQQQAGRGRTDVPDALLFHDEAGRQAAARKKAPHLGYRHGTTFVEAKRWQRPLDRGDAIDPTDPGVPSNQMLRYLSQVEISSEGRILWGILTNGRHWRLYYQRSTNRAEEFLELDLPALFGLVEPAHAFEPDEREHLLSCFLLLFRPSAFLPEAQLDGRSFLDYARNEARLWEAQVAKDLSRLVFQDVFPRLVRGFAARDPQRPDVLSESYLQEIRDAALVFLYRLLFILYAEDRDLLPVRDRRYNDYSLRRPRRDIAKRIDAADPFSSTQDRYYRQVASLFRALAVGDDSIGLPPYNGGLFDEQQHPVLARLSLADDDFAAVLDALSRRRVGDRRLWINFRDLSVQQLGSIYERLLEYRVVAPNGTELEIRQGTYSRRTTGSYYTHEDLVQLVLRRTLGPLVDERREQFLARLEKLTQDHRPYAKRLAELARLDPASRLLELKVVDPAMGSGHFLVSAVDYLADRTLELISEAEQAVEAAGWKKPYSSPLQRRLADIRSDILKHAAEHRWPVEASQLDDRHLVRRILLKRVIYGVDLNPMAVELAKLSLWLHSFTVGAPLSFLNHHLRCGNSLVGAWVEEVRDRMERSGLWGPTYAGVLSAAESMRELQEFTDAELAEVKESARLFRHIEEELEPQRKLLALDTADDWFESTSPRARKRRDAFPGRDVLAGFHGAPVDLVIDPTRAKVPGVRKVVERALDTCCRLRCFPWQLMFPEVWYERGRVKEDGGFDAVIGNPPWDRIKLQQVEFFAERRPEIASAQTAAERKRGIARLEKSGDPLWKEYEAAREYAERFAQYVRQCGHFPLLARGDLNLYPLFVERGQALIHRRGLVGLLVPSGIAADLSSSEFFGELATTGRVSTLYDFENKKPYFSDVDSRFKFAAFVSSGPERTFDAANCAFFVHDIAELAESGRSFPLTPDDFARVNPNTGTAPVFRSRRDAAITTRIYERLPVLIDRSDQERNPWGIRYLRMFDMTNDSGLFRTTADLDSGGCYPVEGSRWKKGDELYVPLYEGKMVQMYDHRAASVEVDPKRTHRPGQPVPATEGQHADTEWCPDPQYWVPSREVRSRLERKQPSERSWYLGFKEITSPTNQRTMIAAMLPAVGAGNKVPLLLGGTTADAGPRACLLAAMNSFAFDFVLRQKLAGQTINLYILEQLPVPWPDAFTSKIGGATLGELVEECVLELTYTAHDMAPFAHELGYDGDPFPWDEEERRHLMACLDAVMFRLYGLDESDIEYVLSTFPIIQRQDDKAYGRFRTRDLILGYFRAHAAGDLHSRVRA